MTVSRLSATEASALAVSVLGLNADVVDLLSREGLAASLRRAASFMCPTSPSRLVSAVLGAVRPLAANVEVDREEVSELLDLLIAAGDLLELRHPDAQTTRLLYLGPPSFIEREPGNYLLLGVRPFGESLVDFDLAPRVEREGHTRNIRLDPQIAHSELADAGLNHIDKKRWIAAPAVEPAEALRERVRHCLDVAASSGEIDGLQVLDPTTPVRFYRGRWRAPRVGDNGDFVARRPQAYGADLWCVVRLLDGAPERLTELPFENPLLPGRDEAWRLQMAFDSLRGVPQSFSVDPTGGGSEVLVKFYSPIPGFAERYLQLVGLALMAPGALFAYRVPSTALPSLAELLRDTLWMATTPAKGHR